MGTDELHENAAERKRYVHDQTVFVAAEIEYGPVVADEIDGAAELPLDLGRISPMRPCGNGEPRANWAFGLWVTRPELPECPTRNHLHGDVISCPQYGDNARYGCG